MTKEAAEELEEMGEDTSDMIMSQSKMREMIMNATKVASNNYKGVDIQTELGNYKSTFQILSEIGAIWDEIKQADLRTGDNRQNLLLEAMAGKNRANTLASVLMNNDILQSAYQDSKYNAAGKATEELEKVSQSITFHLNQLTNAWQELWANAANRDVINMFIDLGTTILNLINDVGGLQSAFTLLYGGTILKGLMTADSWLVKFVQGLDNAKASSQGLGDTLNNVFTNLTGGGDPNKETRWKGLAQIQKNREDAKTGKTKNPIADETKEAIEANKELAESEELVQTATEGSTAAKEADMAAEGAQSVAKSAGAMAEEADAASTANNTDQTNQNTLATEANTAAESAQSVAKGAGGATEAVNSAGGIGGMIAGAAANPMTWLMAIPAVLALISTIINSIKKQQQELIDGEKEAASTWQEAKTGIDEYAQKYQELHAQLQNTNLSEQDQINIKQQIYDLQKQITDEYGHAADGVNLVNGNLDEQLEKLRQIKAEEAKKNLLDNEKEYKNARKAMEQKRSYDMVVARNAPVTQDAQDILKKYGYELKQRSVGMGTVEQYIEFKGDASDAEQALKDLYNEVGEYSEDERVSKGLNTFFDSISAATEQNNQVLRDHQEAYNAFLEAKIFDNDNLYGDAQKTAGEVLIQLEDAVNDYNVALQSGDTSQIEEAQKTFESLKDTVQDITKDMGEVYARPFDDIIDNVNKTAETAYNFQKKMDDPKVHSMAESVFGDLAENKKISKETQDEILDTAGDILNMQRELAKAGLTDIISPLYDPIDKEYKTKFGNIDLNNRPVLNWNQENIKKYRPAWDSWNKGTNGNWGEMPKQGDISTVLGSRGEFGKANYEIAFTPLLETDNGLELLDYSTVTNYLNDIVDKATDKNGNVDAQKLLTIDADPKSGKKLIAAYGKAAESYDHIMHYVGTDGAYTTALTHLKKLADDNGLSVDKMLSSMAQLGNRSGIRDMFKDALPSVTDVRAALEDTTGQFQELQDFAQQEFEITLDSPDSDIEAFINSMQLAGLVATGAAEEAKQSLDDVFQDVSGKIEKVNSLSSVISKGLGQGGLTFTKLLDEQGNVIESDVSKIRDAYQSMYDYDLGSLFEETATGIKLNMDAYRQLAQEEEASTKIQLQNQRDLLEARQRTLEKQGAPDTQIRQLQEQITELDMLAAAYDGATSATAKYLAQQNAADYGDMYEMFRDTTVKRADELMSKGMIGTEEFRSIAQLFSYDSLATASADKALEAYQKGYGTVSKYITEDATVGMQTFLDDLVALPEEYGKFTKDSAGNYMIEFTEAQEDKLAQHLNVSKDMLESFYDMLNALGFNIHFFRDGTLNEFDKLNQNINDSKDRLKELKENANDPNLIPDDVLDFNIEDLNTVEQLEAQLNELKSLDIDPKVNPQEYEAWKNLLDQIQEKIDKVKEAEIDPNVGLKDYEVADDMLDVITQKTEQAQKIAEKGIEVKTAIENDEDIDALANKIANTPKQIQEYMEFTYSTDPEEIKRQLIERIGGVEIPLKPTLDPEVPKEIQDTTNLWSNEELLVGIHVRGDGSGLKEEVKEIVQNPSLSEIDAQVNYHVGENEAAEETKKMEKEGAEIGVAYKPENTPQEALGQSGAKEGVTVTDTHTTENITKNETIATANTDQASQQLLFLDGVIQDMDGRVFTVTGDADTDNAEEKLDSTNEKVNNLDGKKTTVTVGGNTAPFNKSANEVKKTAGEIGKQKPKTEFKGDSSSAVSAAHKVKKAIDDVPKKKDSKLSVTASGIDTIKNFLHNVYNKLTNKSVKIETKQVTTKETIYKTSSGGHQVKVDGTAHVQGTVMSNGKAFATGGNWGLPKAEKGALINELGSEILVRDGQWQVVNNGDPTFVDLKPGDIIFNHKQSKELLKNGHVTGSHGKLIGGSFARGTVTETDNVEDIEVDNYSYEEDLDELMGNAFALGTTKWNGQLSGESHAGGKGGGSLGGAKRAQTGSNKSNKSSGKSSGKSNKSKKSGKSGKSSKSSKSSSSSKAKDFLETLDSIEIQINRIDALFQKLDTDISKTYASFASRASNATSEISKLGDEIKRIDASLNSKSSKTNYLYKAAEAAKAAGLNSGDEGYTKTGAKGTALSQGWITWIQNSVNTGKYMTIDDVKDEGLWKKIQAYQTWYEKYVKLQQKRQDYVNKMSQLTIQQLQLIQTEWEAVLNNLNAYITENQNRVDLQTEQGYDASVRYYNNQINYNKTRLTDLNKEAAALQAKLNEAVSTGRITKYSEEWYKWQTQIKNIQNEVINTTKEIARLNNEIRQLKWDRFDRAQDKLSDLAEEMEFLNGLIYENDKFTEEGNITNRGRAAMGLIAMQYDEYIKQAKRYQKEVAALNKDLANDPYNNKLIEQRNTWLKAQQDAIENARQQKEAMADLIEDGIKKQIDYMDELIDKYEDALDAEKAQNKYAEEMAEKQKKVNSIQKQLRALEGDDSEEGQTRRQKLRDDLKEAQKDLKDAQEDQRLSDISDTLSDMQEKYEDVLNARLDNIDKLFAESVTAVNQNGASIVSEIQAIGKSVDYNFSELLNGIVTDKSTQDKASDTSSKALVSGTNDTTGLLTNTSAAAVKDRDTGWKKSGNDWYYADEYGNAETGWVKDKNKWYYLDDNGKMTTGWQQVNGKWYHMDNSGAMQSGWQKIKNKWYYLNDENDGSMATGWKKVKDKWYYMDSSGAMQTGWQQVNNKWYYLDGSGAMKTGWQKSNNKWYYLDKKTGAMTTGWQKDQNKWYYMDQTGKMTTGWQQVNNKWYYMDGSGAMQTGWKKSNNKWYYLKDDGSMATGWQRVSNKWYYMDNSGAMTTGWQKVNNKWYYMNGSGQMLTGEQKIGQNTYYLGQDGAMRTGKFVVNGITYITDSSGKIKSKVRGKYAKGTANVKQTGLYQVDEQGEEVFINKQGKIYTRLEKGSTVLPHDAAVNLLKGMTNPAEFIANHMDMRPNKNITTTNNTSGNVTNYITFNMDGVTNYQEFMREAQRDPNFTKYIQEISIGKLNGNNSLKGNSIRFR